ncbi:hypothetical protein HDA32_004315 [Spinactinospora alkalitolerans]|uniref:Lipoprotein n=1 Tax=Spinactinospora alkalitolerans TaxID=687207 RepID=A0A852U0Y7_9ACTN|nr:hypothetical protein [Spinactinospora alkalitolerans]NYE49195.1 hypothetical protein [Spinactinospora alkalitolerans]
MTRGPRPKALGPPAIATMLAVGACACAPAAPLPDGFTETETDHVVVAHPRDWRTTDPGGEAVLTIVDAEEPIAQIDVLENVVHAPIPEHALAVTQSGRQSLWRDYEQERSEISASGAEHAYQVDFGYTAEDGDRVKGIDVIMIDGSDMAHQVKVTWLQDELDPDIPDSIADTVGATD